MITVLKFYADWCGPCKAMEPAWNQLQEESHDTIFQSINIEDNPQMRADFSIRSIPAIVIVKNGKEIARRTGGASVNDLKDWINESRSL